MLKLKLQQGSLLKNAVPSIVNIGTLVIINFSQDGLSIHVADDKDLVVLAVLRLRSLAFDCFDCDRPGSISIDLTRFLEMLNLATDEEAITILFGDPKNIKTYRGDKKLKFSFEILGTDQSRCYTMEFSKARKPDDVDADADESRYDTIIVIPSQEFSHVFRLLGIPDDTGIDDGLFISISNEQMEFFVFGEYFKCPKPSKFSARGEEIVLAKEKGQYEILGAAIDQPIKGVFSIDHASSYLKAADLSDKIWILGSSESVILMKCPIRQLGDVIFYLFPTSVSE